MSIDEIKKLNPKERIALVNDILESFEAQSDTIEPPKWHEGALQERMEKMKNNSAKYISLEELKQR